jgi:hypothetical protein
MCIDNINQCWEGVNCLPVIWPKILAIVLLSIVVILAGYWIYSSRPDPDKDKGGE